jgi:hypothetical protein
MRSMLGIAAVGALLSVIVLWDLAVVAVLRFSGIKLLFSTPFRFHTRKESEVLAALRGKSKTMYIFIYGFLFFACPLIAGSAAFDYVVRRYIDRSTFGLDYVTGEMVLFVILAIAGVWISDRSWRKLADKRIVAAN